MIIRDASPFFAPEACRLFLQSFQLAMLSAHSMVDTISRKVQTHNHDSDVTLL